MRSGQWETVIVLADLVNVDFPPADGMTVLANRAHLAAVNVGMAVGALVSHIGKDHLDVAGRAGHALVHAAQRKLGGVVIEFGNGPDGPPSINGVAVLTGDIQRAVRTSAVNA
jgi:hypothetical protein